MNVITVSRAYGAGGHELAERLANALGWELLDRELLHQAAAVEHVPDADMVRLDEKAVSWTERLRLHPPHVHYVHGLRTAARAAAVKGNVILVGRGTAQLLADLPNVFHLRLVADLDWRALRMAQIHNWSFAQAVERCTAEDDNRARFTRYFFGDEAQQPESYDLIVNTGRVTLEDVVAMVAGIVRKEPVTLAPGGAQVLTLSRQRGAGVAGFKRALARQLNLQTYDRELLEQEAQRLGVSAAELEQIDERPSGIFERLMSSTMNQRYFDTMGKLMSDLAARGNVMLVGRGGNRFLRDCPAAFHVRLVASRSARVRHFMEYHWVREAVAQTQLSESDAQRQRYFAAYFGADWADPLEYHLTVNAGRQTSAVDLIVRAATRFWNRASVPREGVTDG